MTTTRTAQTAAYISTAYVVTWTPESTGGFDWFTERSDAAMQVRCLQDPTARIHVVAVPDSIATVPHKITEWLDDEGWSDGGDPRR